MSKLFNIEEFHGGAEADFKKIEIEKKFQKFNKDNHFNKENLENFFKAVEENFKTVKENNIDENVKNTIIDENVKNTIGTPTFQNFYNNFKNEYVANKELDINQLKSTLINFLNNYKETKRVEELLNIIQTYKPSVVNPPVQPQNANPPVQPQNAQNSTECILIGVIDETGTFVGVKSVSNTDNELFEKLKVIIEYLKNNNLKDNDRQQNSVGTIYDKFIKNTCNKEFVDDYEKKFLNSQELKELQSKSNL